MTFDLSPYRHLYPFESRWLNIDGQRMHYVDEGAGEPILFVHGNPTWSFFFRRLIVELRKDYRVIAMDHIGCGLSDKPDDRAYNHTLARRAADLDALIDHLGLTTFSMGMHDWGGMIGTTSALRHLPAIRSLVYFNTAAFLLPAPKRMPLRLSLIRSVPLIGAPLVLGLNAFARSAINMAVVKKLPRDVAAAYLAPYDRWSHRRAVLRFVQDIPLKPGDQAYETVKHVDDNLHTLQDIPTFIAWGERDFVFDRHFLDEWRKRLPQASIHAFPDAGHYVLEDAGDQIVPLLRDFLAQHHYRVSAVDTVEAAS